MIALSVGLIYIKPMQQIKVCIFSLMLLSNAWAACYVRDTLGCEEIFRMKPMISYSCVFCGEYKELSDQIKQLPNQVDLKVNYIDQSGLRRVTVKPFIVSSSLLISNASVDFLEEELSARKARVATAMEACQQKYKEFVEKLPFCK